MTRSLRIAIPVVVLLWLGIAMVARAGDRPEVALAITEASWADATHLWVYTECAELTDVDVDRERVPTEVSLWGKPKAGRCEEWALVRVPFGSRKITDGATNKVIDLPAYVKTPGGGGHQH